MNSTVALAASNGSEQAMAPLCCIVGATAAGKSALAMQLAEARGLSIVSADSRQVYRGFDIGTAKPSHEDRRCVPHYGLDVVDPEERYSAHRWALEATRWCDEARSADRSPLVVGGTGLYVRALVQPLDAVPELDADRRAALEPWLASQSLHELQRWCARLDPVRAHLGRTQLQRAIETALLDGTRLGDHLARPQTTARPVRYLVVDPGPALALRIADRVQAMLAAGFVEEIERLRTHIPADAPAWNASGYGVLRQYVEGTLPRSAAIERVIIETRQYAKRQRTWFRHQLPTEAVTLVNPLEEDARDITLAWWDAAQQSDGVHT
ncbi:tRNA (adenosine(37)-N6)-dimethylallyltransferase MiaA [Gemmatimonas sp.]|jgi:tRNA dimethylallyltransferase|uniref:tRNA (adenosine(37)-N6)-dimethylallyltransferase MiaA n=1 Tax=Gemmatimonas sp. TaxID=1962908 RepID=UPI0037C07460